MCSPEKTQGREPCQRRWIRGATFRAPKAWYDLFKQLGGEVQMVPGGRLNGRKVVRGAVFRLAVAALVTGWPLVRLAHAEPSALFAQISVSGRSACTGAVVLLNQQRHFVTAAHCLTGLDDDVSISVSEGARVKRAQVVERSGHLDLQVGRATVLLDFDVAIWPLAFHQLTHTATLTPRLTELAPGEGVTTFGYPGEDGPTTLACAATSGPLAQVDGFGFRPAQGMTCATSITKLGGLSGGPVVDANGRYLGLADYQSVSGTPNVAQAGFVPYRVFKPVNAPDGSATWAGLRYGFTFRDYVVDADGGVIVHAAFDQVNEPFVTRARLRSINVRTPVNTVEFRAGNIRSMTALMMRVIDADGRPVPTGVTDITGASYQVIRSNLVLLRH